MADGEKRLGVRLRDEAEISLICTDGKRDKTGCSRYVSNCTSHGCTSFNYLLLSLHTEIEVNGCEQ